MWYGSHVVCHNRCRLSSDLLPNEAKQITCSNGHGGESERDGGGEVREAPVTSPALALAYSSVSSYN